MYLTYRAGKQSRRGLRLDIPSAHEAQSPNSWRSQAAETFMGRGYLLEVNTLRGETSTGYLVSQPEPPKKKKKNPDSFHKLARCLRNPTGLLRVPGGHYRAARTHDYKGISGVCVTRLARPLFHFFFFFSCRLRASERARERGCV